MSIQDIEKMFKDFSKAVDAKDTSKGSDMLTKLKVALTGLESFPPMPPIKQETIPELLLCRNVFEYACLLSLIDDDLEGFQRHMNQLNPFYSDFAQFLSPSDKQGLISGLHLFILLVESKLAEFHSELELLSDAEIKDKHIAFVVDLERNLMVGTYDRILEAKAHVPHPLYETLLKSLVSTVRVSIAECTEVSYDSLTFESAKTLLKFGSDQELSDFIQNNFEDWQVDEAGKVIQFKHPKVAKGKDDIPNMKVINQMLSYANELERIV